MYEPQRARMQRLACHQTQKPPRLTSELRGDAGESAFTAPVGGIPKYGVSRVAQMNPDLMGAARL